VVALAFGLASWTGVNAQTIFELGVKGGVGFAGLGGSGLSTTEPVSGSFNGGYFVGSATADLNDMKTGFTGGAYAVARLNPRFGIRLEALFTSKGSKGNNTGAIDVYDNSNNFLGTATISGTNTLTLNYFEIPLLAVGYLPAGPSDDVEFFVGPSLGIRTKAESKSDVTLSAGGQSQTESQTTDLGSTAEGTDFGGVLGIGYSHRMSAVTISADARWTQGFSKVNNTGTVDWKNHLLGLVVGVGFPVGGKK
jgi:hypothetical protein